MIGDVWTVMWKEWKDFPLRQGGLRGGWLGLLAFVSIFGIFLPLQMGHALVQSPALLLSWAWVPFILVTNVIADSFAGERERHTLESLLTTPLSDRAILLGKVGAAVAYAWGLTVISVALGLVTVNVAHGRGELLLYPAPVALGAAALSLLVAGLAAGAGVLVSLRSTTVRQAQQTLGFGLMALVFVPVLGVQALPAPWKARLLQTLTVSGALQDVTLVVLTAAAVLVLLDAALLAAAVARFRRARLILD